MKRYYTNAKDSDVWEHPDGPFVLWSDYARLERENDALADKACAAVLRYRSALEKLTDSFKYSTEVVTIAREALEGAP